MSTQIKPLDSVAVTADGAGVVAIPTGSIEDFQETSSAPLYINVFVTGSGNCFIQASGSSQSADGRYVASGASAQYGPVQFANFPQLRFDGGSGAWISFDALISEK